MGKVETALSCAQKVRSHGRSCGVLGGEVGTPEIEAGKQGGEESLPGV